MENDFKYGNFTREDVTQFPIDCETMETLQNNTRLMSVIARIAGAEHEGTHLLILSGCKKNGTRRTAGYVYISGPETADGGEILYHPEQPDASTCFIEKTHDDVTANGQTFSQAYTTRRLISGSGPNAHAWKNFTDIATISNAELSERIEQRYEAVNNSINTINSKYDTLNEYICSQLVKGMIIMWSGHSYEVPNGWALCDGSKGTPNLINRFIRGGSERSTGGSNTVTLSSSHIPRLLDVDFPAANARGGGYPDIVHRSWPGGNWFTKIGTYCAGWANGADDSHGVIYKMSIGEEKPSSFDIVPEYYALCFIMKL